MVSFVGNPTQSIGSYANVDRRMQLRKQVWHNFHLMKTFHLWPLARNLVNKKKLRGSPTNLGHHPFATSAPADGGQ